MIRVFIAGVSGNVGKVIVRTMQGMEDFELVGGWCRQAGEDIGALAGIGALGIAASAAIEEGIAAAKPDLAIDFSATPVLADNMRAYLKHGLNAVIGATGLTDEQFEPFKREVAAKGLRWAAIPNFSIGISLVSRFIKEARQYYPFATVTDQHTDEMANAPSGTALSLARTAGGAVGRTASREVCPGALGATVEGVQVLSQRLPFPGPYSGHEITLGRKDEIIRVSVQAFTSDIYMDGIFLTARRIASFPAGSFVRSLDEIMA